MKQFLKGAIALAVFGLAFVSFSPSAQAGHFHSKLPQGAQAISTDCEETSGWYVNGDETNRKPEVTATGFKFEASDLIHREADLPLKDLVPGNYTLAGGSLAPDQPSFFSVEVRNSSGAYGTLRWDKNAGLWRIVIGSGTTPGGVAATNGIFSGADPLALLEGKVTKWGAFDPATAKVVSFGIGYTLNPPGENPTTIKSVSFKGKDYTLVCVPPTSPSPSGSGSTTVSPNPGQFYKTCAEAPHKLVKGLDPGYRPELDSDGDGTACEERGDRPSLPVTGARVWILVGAGASMIAIGLLAVGVSRRRRTS